MAPERSGGLGENKIHCPWRDSNPGTSIRQPNRYISYASLGSWKVLIRHWKPLAVLQKSLHFSSVSDYCNSRSLLNQCE